MKNFRILLLYSLLGFLFTYCHDKEDTFSFKENLKKESIRSVLKKSKTKEDSVLIEQALYSNPKEFGFEELTIQKEGYPDITEFNIYIRQLKNEKEEFVLLNKTARLKDGGSSVSFSVESHRCLCSGAVSDMAPEYFDDICENTGSGAINMRYVSEGHGQSAYGKGKWISFESGTFRGNYPDGGLAQEAIRQAPDGWIE